jgi:hypothetical protein
VIPGLVAALADLAARGQTTPYGALARDLGIPGPGSIAKLTAALEALMAEDAAAGRAFRAALCTSRLSNLPAQGFFDTATALGRYTPGTDPAAYVEAERETLAMGKGDSP